MQTIQTKEYPIYFKKDGYTALETFLKEKKPTKVFLLVDSNTHELCLPYFMGEINGLDNVEIIEVEAGEINKNIETVTQVWLALSELGADRKSLLINLGGGVVTDMGGFIASTFKRGIDCINIPTTLLSQVDASVGGKTGIDLDSMKNQVGTFSFPKMILIDSTYLKTLPSREVYSGFAEMLKHGLIANKAHWDSLIELKEITPTNVLPYVSDSILVKKQVTEEDPYEKGLRKILNFGHTLGHAIESHYLETDETFLHGEAIIIGMVTESHMAFQLELINESDLSHISKNLLKFYDLHKIDPSDYPSILNWMQHDKKNEAQQVNFSLINAIGSCQYNKQVKLEQIIASLDYYNGL